MNPSPRTTLPCPFNCWHLPVLLCLFLLAGCGPSAQTVSARVSVQILADGQSQTVELPAGSTVSDALDQIHLIPSAMDRLDHDPDQLLVDGMQIHLVRITEQYVMEEISIPYETQTIIDESLPLGQKSVIQAGVTGLLQNTYRLLLEEDVELSRTLFRQQVLMEARPEIVMTGVQEPITPVAVPGKIAYLTEGNAWLMQGSSDHRTPLIMTGDLDGRVFSLSQDGRWLLYTSSLQPSESGDLNELWFVDTEADTLQPVSLGIRNIIHFADWQPDGGLTVAYSTVEPREAAPGWQANNDLILAAFDSGGTILNSVTLLEPGPGGVYGWWGTTYLWSPDGQYLAYSQTDSVGWVNVQTGEIKELAAILPYQPENGTAWLPDLSWSPDGRRLYFTNHASGGAFDDIPNGFFLSVVDVYHTSEARIVTEQALNAQALSVAPSPRQDYNLVWLQQAVSGTANTGYHLNAAISEEEISLEALPLEPELELEVQEVQWCPSETLCPDALVSVLYQSDIWILNLKTLKFTRITGDGSVKLIDWK